MARDMIRIGNAGGYWGDDPDALRRQIFSGPLDYVTIDFLAEITMSIMQKQRAKDPSSGYARDLIGMLETTIEEMLNRRVKLITNAGGVNPIACAAAVQTLADKLKLKPKISLVVGDDIFDKLADIDRTETCTLKNMENGAAFDGIKDRVEAANIYFGAYPVAESLKWDPDVVITGRVTDTGITLGPMIHEFGWQRTDWDLLASGIVAGHIIECGCQSTGGNFTDWHQIGSFLHMGYPIIEMKSDGSFIVTKHPGSGGLVTVDTVREQLFYEMGEPKAYITPDVIADFSTIRLEQAGSNRVRVFGVKGYEPTPFYKVSMAYSDGFKTQGAIAISGPGARLKAETFAQIFWKKVAEDLPSAPEGTATEYYGFNAMHRSLGDNVDGAEILLKLSARDQDEKKLRLFSKLIPTLILSGPPGVCVTGGVPKPQEVISYWPTLIPKQQVKPQVLFMEGGICVQSQTLEDEKIGDSSPEKGLCDQADHPSENVVKARKLTEKPGEGLVPLQSICLARSGDKGDTCNIGVMARSPKAFAFLETFLTAQRVKDLFQELCLGSVKRYKLSNLGGFNFLLEEALDGGGTVTLRTDAQGKTFAQALLRQKVPVPHDVLIDVEKTQKEQISWL